MRIAVIGASGWRGGAVAREALSRGHEVTAIGRDVQRLAALESMARDDGGAFRTSGRSHVRS